MKEMDRLIDECDDEFTRALLLEGRRPLEDSRRTTRVLAAVGVGGLVLGKAGWAAASSWKQVALAAVVSVGGGVTAYQLIHDSEPARNQAVAHVAQTRDSNATQPNNDPTEGALPAESETGNLAARSNTAAQRNAAAQRNTAADESASVRIASRAEVQREPVKGALRSPGRSARGGTLGFEVAMLDRSRALLQQGDAAGALTVLDRYRAEYPNGSLSLEAELVRIPALARLGRRKEASDRASRVLARKPNSVVAEQLRTYVTP